MFFQFLTHGKLLNPANVNNLIMQNAYVVILAIGMIMVIIAGHIDLSRRITRRYDRRIRRGRHPGMALAVARRRPSSQSSSARSPASGKGIGSPS